VGLERSNTQRVRERACQRAFFKISNPFSYRILTVQRSRDHAGRLFEVRHHDLPSAVVHFGRTGITSASLVGG